METDTTTAPPLTATLACGHDVYVTPDQSAAGQAFHCGHFRDITRLPGQAAQAGPPSPGTERAASVAALRAIADGYARLAAAIEARPAIPAPHISVLDPYVLLCVQTAGELAAAARALPCTLAKDADEKWFNLNGKISGLKIQLYAARERVCTITGYEDREVEEVVTPAVTEKVTKSVPVWECAPILAARPEPSTP